MPPTVRTGCYNVAVHRADPIELAADGLAVTILPAHGARLHAVRAHGHDLLRTPAEPTTHRAEPFFWGGYHMAPWPNRIAARPTPVVGDVVDVPANHTDGTAMHGLHVATTWDVAAVSDTTAELTTAGGGAGTGWPWTHTVSVRHALTADDSSVRLTLAYALTNTSDRPMPAGLGFHPWFRTPATVQVPAAAAFADNTDTAARPEPVTGDLDLRDPRPLATGVDACWVDLAEPCVRLSWDDLGLELAMSADDPGIVAVAAHPAGFGAVAVELQTCAPAGVRRLVGAEPYALRPLDPGGRLDLVVELAFSRR